MGANSSRIGQLPIGFGGSLRKDISAVHTEYFVYHFLMTRLISAAAVPAIFREPNRKPHGCASFHFISALPPSFWRRRTLTWQTGCFENKVFTPENEDSQNATNAKKKTLFQFINDFSHLPVSDPPFLHHVSHRESRGGFAARFRTPLGEGRD